MLGAKMPETNKNELLKICASNDIPVSQMHMADDKFELTAVALGHL